jgi:uncharacterized protein YjdB
MTEARTSCRSCGNAILPSDAFCSRCGTSVRVGGLDAGAERRTLVRGALPTGERRHCGSCNAPLFPGDAFCAACGSTQSPESTTSSGVFEPVAHFRPLVEDASRGRYRIVREIGRGGMGAVFLAEDTEFSRKVAIKILSGGTSDPAALRRFEREARTVAQLRHDAIVRVHDVGGVGDLHFFVMDYVEGVSLQRFLQAEGQLPIAIVEAVLYRVGVGLAHAHAQPNPVVHRDVKPSNILVDTEGLVTIMDFGVAKVGQDSAGLTRTGMIVGTPEYISPEQVRSAPVSPATDQYALGAVTFAMLTGRPPFAGSFYEVLIAHQKEEVPDVREVRSDVPEALAAAVERMLRKDPGDRWPGIPEILRELDLRPLSPYDPVSMEMARLSRTLFTEGPPGAEDRGGLSVGLTSTGGSLRITLPRDRIEVGDTLVLEVDLETADGRVEPVADVSWSTIPPDVVRVDEGTGELVAVAPGAATLTAVGAGVDGSVEITVAPPEVTRITLGPGELALVEGESAQIDARTLSRSGKVLDHPRTWASSDPAVVSVSADGTVKALGAGAASVVLYCDSAWAAAAVRVEAAPAPAAEENSWPSASPATPPPATPPPGAPTSATAARPAPEPAATPAGAAEERPNTERASSPTGGVVSRPRHRRERGSGRGPVPYLAAAGVALLLAGGGWWASSRPEGGEGVPATSAGVAVGGTGATESGEEGGAAPPASGDDASGVPDPVGEPPEPVWAALEVRDGEGVRPISDPLVLTAGTVTSLSAVLLDAAGEAVDGPAPDWSSDDASVVRVSEGAIEALRAGTARIRARVSEVESSVTIRVRAAAPPRPAWSALELRETDGRRTLAGPVVLTAGQTRSLRGVLLDDGGERVEGPAPRWSSDNVGIARVDDGTVRAVGVGSTRIRARVEGLAANVEVIVRAPATPEPEGEEDDDPPPPRDGALIIRLTGGLWANVRVDGRILGEYGTSYELSPLSAGEHRVRLEGNPAATPVDTIIIIPPGETVTWERRLGGGSPE